MLSETSYSQYTTNDFIYTKFADLLNQTRFHAGLHISAKEGIFEVSILIDIL
jgi:hypothetical protein